MLLSIFSHLNKILLQERSQWILWVPVAMGIGIGIYFSLPYEPSPLYSSTLFLSSLLLGISFYKRLRGYPFFFLSICFVLLNSFGFSFICWKTQFLSTPFLEKNVGPIKVEGKIERIEYPPSSIRLILTHLAFDQDYPYKEEKKIKKFPKKIRLTLRSSQLQKASLPLTLEPGDKIQLAIKLRPLPWPAFPGGHDFRRKSYFEGIGATGYAITSPTLLKKRSSFSFFLWVQHVRHTLTAHILSLLPSPTGPIATALITGDRSGIPQNISDAYANAGVAHILAISGLHLSLVAGFAFLLSRRLLCFFPSLVLKYSLKKWASVAAFFVISIYLGLSGAGYPVERAFVMTSLVLLAILIDRIALTLRSVALAALVILILFPESLISASFGLSFAAVVGLITAYEAWSERKTPTLEPKHPYLSLITKYIVGILFSTLIATLATTPYTLFFFHKFTLQGFIANLLSIPLTGFWILPWGFIGVLLTPLKLGFEKFPFYLMGKGIEEMTHIALWVSTWPGAQIRIPFLPSFFIESITLGGLWLCLWKTKWRLGGLIPIVLACVFIPFTPSPTVLISSTANLVGVKDESTFYVSSLRKNKFTRTRWEEALAFSSSEKWPENSLNTAPSFPFFVFSFKETKNAPSPIILVHKGVKNLSLEFLPFHPSLIIFQDPAESALLPPFTCLNQELESRIKSENDIQEKSCLTPFSTKILEKKNPDTLTWDSRTDTQIKFGYGIQEKSSSCQARGSYSTANLRHTEALKNVLCLDWFDVWHNGSYVLFWNAKKHVWTYTAAREKIGNRPWVKNFRKA